VQLSVVGLGKLGAPLAAVLASAGHDVIGVDTAARVVSDVNAGTAPVVEPGLQALMTSAGGRLRATTDLATAILATEMTFVIVPTPSGADGTFRLDYMLQAVTAIGGALGGAADHRHLVVITSTVMPGSTEGPIRAALEDAAGRPLGDDLALCYSPEFIALGSVIRDMTHPDLFLVGAAQRAWGERLAAVLLSFAPERPPVVHLSPVDAEMAKLAVNTFVTTKISYANMLAEICEGLPGADAEKVAAAVGLDTRIGPKYLRPGAPYGGPCFPRDNVALSSLARSLGGTADVAEATDRINRRQASRLAKVAVTHLGPNRTAAVLGLTYKPGTPVVEEAAGIAVAAALLDAGVSVTVHDPLGMNAARLILGNGVRWADDVAEALDGAEVAVVTTPWPDYAGVAATPGSRTVIDCWRCCTEPAAAGVTLIFPGRATPTLEVAPTA
jgi:UDPglucose 6-dehydrogenase